MESSLCKDFCAGYRIQTTKAHLSLSLSAATLWGEGLNQRLALHPLVLFSQGSGRAQRGEDRPRSHSKSVAMQGLNPGLQSQITLVLESWLRH